MGLGQNLALHEAVHAAVADGTLVVDWRLLDLFPLVDTERRMTA